MPWHIEDVLRERGANYIEGGLWRPFAVRDGNLITGQQQHSGRPGAQLVIETLGCGMRIGIIGAGRIGGNAGRLLEQAGHEVFLGSRETLAEAASFSDVVMLSVPWTAVDEVLAKAGPLDGKVVIDTTNPYGSGGVQDLGGRSAGRVNSERMLGARIVRAFNTLTSGFQSDAAGRSGDDRVVMFLSGDDEEAKRLVGGLIDEIGFAPVDIGGSTRPSPTRRAATARSTARSTAHPRQHRSSLHCVRENRSRRRRATTELARRAGPSQPCP
jgi:predicted dinucleotide-binding enzyme